MRILGVDPGTALTGFGIIDYEKTGTQLVAGGVIRTPAKQELAKRLATIFQEMSSLIKEYRPEQVAVEHLYFASNVSTAMSVSQARGVVLLCAAQAKLPISEYTPLQVKQAVTGYGRAEKKQIQEMVRTLLGLKELPKPDDAADAIAIAICHSATISP